MKTPLYQIVSTVSSLFLAVGCNRYEPEPKTQIQGLHVQKEQEAKAIKELRKIQSLTSIGLNFGAYDKAILESKPLVDEALRALPDGPEKDRITLVMNTYVDARAFWRIYMEKENDEIEMGIENEDSKYRLFSFEERGQFSRYNLPWRWGASGTYGKPSMVRLFWTLASAGLDRVETPRTSGDSKESVVSKAGEAVPAFASNEFDGNWILIHRFEEPEVTSDVATLCRIAYPDRLDLITLNQDPLRGSFTMILFTNAEAHRIIGDWDVKLDQFTLKNFFFQKPKAEPDDAQIRRKNYAQYTFSFINKDLFLRVSDELPTATYEKAPP